MFQYPEKKKASEKKIGVTKEDSDVDEDEPEQKKKKKLVYGKTSFHINTYWKY